MIIICIGKTEKKRELVFDGGSTIGSTINIQGIERESDEMIDNIFM